MPGFCPQCDKQQGLSPCAGRLQQWSTPIPVCSNMPAELAHLVPMIVKGQECEHTISLDSFKSHNQ